MSGTSDESCRQVNWSLTNTEGGGGGGGGARALGACVLGAALHHRSWSRQPQDVILLNQ